MTSKLSRSRGFRVSSGLVAGAATVLTVGAMQTPAANASAAKPNTNSQTATATITPATNSTFPNTCATFTLTTTQTGGAASAGTIATITASEPVGTANNPNATPTFCTPADGSAGATSTGTNTTTGNGAVNERTGTIQTGSDGTAEFGVENSVAATVTVQATVNGTGAGGNGTVTSNAATLTVNPGTSPTGNGSVNNLNIIGDNNQAAGANSTAQFELQARNGTGNTSVPVSGAQVEYQIVSGPDQSTTVYLCSGLTDSSGDVLCNVKTGGAATTSNNIDTVQFFVNNNGTTTSQAYQNGDPQVEGTITVQSTDVITLSNVPAPGVANKTVTVSAAVADSAGNSADAGIAVQFVVTGANSASGLGTTNGSGVATFSYVPTHTGTDYVTATETGSTQNNQVVANGTATKIIYIHSTGSTGTSAGFYTSQTVTSSNPGKIHIYMQTIPARAGALVNFYNIQSDGSVHHLGSSATTANNGTVHVTFSKSPGTYRVFEVTGTSQYKSGVKTITVH